MRFRELARGFAILLILVPMGASIAWALGVPEDPTISPSQTEGNETSLTALLFRVAISLGFIVLLIWGAVWLMRRFSPGALRPGGDYGMVEIIGQRSIGPKKAIYILRVADRALAVGITESTMAPLIELDLDEILVASEGKVGQDSDRFSGILKGLKTRLSGEDK